MKTLTSERLDHLRLAAGIAERLGTQNTIWITAPELTALIDRDEATVLDVVKIAFAGQCSCAAAGCVHDAIRAAARGDAWRVADQQMNQTTLERDMARREREGTKALLADAERQLAEVRAELGPAVTPDASSVSTPGLARMAAKRIAARDRDLDVLAGELADAVRRTGKLAAPPVVATHDGARAYLTVSLDDLAILAEGLEYLHSTTAAIVERGGREFLPAQAELVERQRRLLVMLRGMLAEASGRPAKEARDVEVGS